MSVVSRRVKNRRDEAGGVETPLRTKRRHSSKWNSADDPRGAESKSEETSPLRNYLSCTFELDIDCMAPPTPKDLCDRQLHIQIGNDADENSPIPSDFGKVDVSNFALGLRSPVFRRMLSAESGFAESGRDAVVVRIPRDQVTGFKVMIRLLHVQSEEIEHHLECIIWPKLLIQLIVICDRFRVMDLIAPILGKYENLINIIPPKTPTGTLPLINSDARVGFGVLSGTQSLDLDDDVEEVSDYELHDEFEMDNETEEHESATEDLYFGCDKRRRTINNHADLMYKRARRQKYIGMSVDELIEILNLSVPNIDCLQKLLRITAEAVCNRFSQLEFDDRGIVDEKFRMLPAKAIKLILEQSKLRSWSENDVFLAACQWANNDCCRHLSDIADGIRFHCMDAWFLAEIVSRHPQVLNTPHLYEPVVDCLRVASLNLPTRKPFVCKFLEDKLKPRRTPSNLDGSSFNGHNGISRALYTPSTVQRRIAEYDTFEVTFGRRECSNLEVNGRVTSRYLIWRGITFAIDLVRKQSSDRAGETVGVFLYCQGLVGTGKIMVRYGIQTANHQHQLTCSDYKCMHLNFRRGNGSRDFFQCTWDAFLNTYFDHSKLVLRVVFLAIE